MHIHYHLQRRIYTIRDVFAFGQKVLGRYEFWLDNLVVDGMC
jgi:hypothetical protein